MIQTQIAFKSIAKHSTCAIISLFLRIEYSGSYKRWYDLLTKRYFPNKQATIRGWLYHFCALYPVHWEYIMESRAVTESNAYSVNVFNN